MRRRQHHDLLMTAHRRQPVQGFTLLEFLVVMSILALIMTAAFGAVRLGSVSFAAGVTRADETEQIRATATFLQRQFAQLATIVYQLDAETEISFQGDRGNIRFVAPAPQYSASAGLFVYSLTAEGHYGQRKLMLAHAPYDPGAEVFAAMQDAAPVTLVPQLSDIRFEYYGRKFQHEDPAWYDSWGGEQAIFPRLIRIHLATAQGDSRWPELTFVVQADNS
jgi:prepilin-type N-terminal cleavage/methylation domain-containing protein